MTADHAGTPGGADAEVKRDIPAPEFHDFTLHQPRLIGTMHIMANLACTSLITFIDMQKVQIGITVSKSGLASTTMLRHPLIVALETQGIL